MKWLRALKRTMIILALYGIGILEAHFIPRYGYGLEWVLGAIGLTAFLAGLWVRTHWDN
jgi:hypothetical protein